MIPAVFIEWAADSRSPACIAAKASRYFCSASFISAGAHAAASSARASSIILFTRIRASPSHAWRPWTFS